MSVPPQTYNIPNLTNYRDYKITVRVKNKNGTLSSTPQIVLIRPLPVPGKAQEISATAVGDGRVSARIKYFLTGTAFPTSRRTDISGCDISFGIVGSSTRTVRTLDISKSVVASGMAGSDYMTFNIGELVNKSQYEMSIRLLNLYNVRAAQASDVITFTPLATPLAPVVTGTEADARVTLSITADGADAGYVNGFVITKKSGGGAATELVAGEIADDVVGVNTRSLAVTGLLNGTTYTFGVKTRNTNGVLGAERTINLTPSVPVPITYKSVSLGYQHGGAVTSAGGLMMWGLNASGELGTGDTTFRAYATSIAGQTGVISVACNQARDSSDKAATTHILYSDGTVSGTGANGNGQLGRGTTSTREQTFGNVRTLTGPLTNVVDIASGHLFSLAVTGSGNVFGWGTSSSGQLGLAATTIVSNAQQISVTSGGNMVQIYKVAAGYTHSLLLATNGDVYSMGNNGESQLGYTLTGGLISTATPTRITTLSNIVHIAAFGSNSLALASDGTVFGWGRNVSRQVSSASSVQVMPTRILTAVGTNLTNVVGISLGLDHCTYVLANGTAVSTGSNINLQYCDGTTVTPANPFYATRNVRSSVSVNLENIVGVASAHNYTLFLLANGTLVGGGTTTLNSWSSGDGNANPVTSFANIFVKTSSTANLTGVAVRRPAFSSVTFTVAASTKYSVNTLLASPLFQYQPGTVQQRGIAIVGAEGAWSYSIGGANGTYTTITVVGNTSAVLLRADPLVFIQSPANVGSLQLRAWDGRYSGTTPPNGLVIIGVDTTATDLFISTSFGALPV